MACDQARRCNNCNLLPFFLAPVLPLNLPQYYFYPWSEQATCDPNIGDIQVFSSVGLFLTTVGLVIAPSSSQPVQFYASTTVTSCA